ncbi:MAG: hypothetical protein Q7I99_03775 [Acholeplasmataceae bacterium]|nr:hypothetical protein [Acholeplasmataceae bacterium]
MIETIEIITNINADDVKEKAKEMSNKYNFFISEKEDRIVLKREILYSNGTSSVVQKYTIIPKQKDGKTEVILSLKIDSNFVNKTIEKMYVSKSNTIKTLNSFKNVMLCLFDDDMPLSEDEYNISGIEEPTSTGLKIFKFFIYAISFGILLFVFQKSCSL